MPKCGIILAAVRVLIGAALCLPYAARAAQFGVHVWGTEEGLPQSSVISLTETRDGYLWAGTVDGLTRFDGIRFTSFNAGNTPGLGGGPIVSLFEDAKSNLWIGTETAGIVLLKGGRLINVGLGKGSREGRLLSACEDSSGAVWLYTANGQLGRHLNGDVDVWGVEGGPSQLRLLVPESTNTLWVCTDRGQIGVDTRAVASSSPLPVTARLPVARRMDYMLASRSGGYWRLADGRIQKCTGNHVDRDCGPYPDILNTDHTPITAACEDQEGNLVLGTSGAGVIWFNAEGKATQLSSMLSSPSVLSLRMDREGNLWVGTDGRGLDRVRRLQFDVLEESRDKTVTSVSGDTNNAVWFGTFGGGLYLCQSNAVKHIGMTQGLTTNFIVRSVMVDRSQSVWVSAARPDPLQGRIIEFFLQVLNERFQIPPSTEMLSAGIQAMAQDSKGRLWMGTPRGLACREDQKWLEYKMSAGLSAPDVRAIVEGRDGGLWVGTHGGGLNLLRDGKFSAFHHSDTNGPPSDDITALLLDEDGILWIGTDASGLGRYLDGKWTTYTSHEGLASGSIRYLLDDGDGNLWIGSNAGLMRAPRKSLNEFANGSTNSVPCRTYQKEDGLPTRECSRAAEPAAYRAPDGKLWFPTTSGLVSLDPPKLKPNTNPPPVVIESVKIEGREQMAGSIRGRLPETIVVPAGKEQVEIEYTSLNLSAPEKARFKYRLDGHETRWTDAGDTRVVRYSNLAPGDYHFHVIACNEDGVWNNTGSILAMKVMPPFWLTWWFMSITVLVILGLVAGIVHYVSTQKLQAQLEGLRQQQALEKERSRIARDIHDQLGASLTQVALLGELVESDKDDPTEVEAHARQISLTARDVSRTLDEIVWAVNPSNDTLDMLVNYFCKHAQEYLSVAGLTYRLEVPPELPKTPIPPEVRHNVFLAAKESVTNIVRHAKATSAKIRLRVEPGKFTLEIEDNGKGLAGLDERAAKLRNGLSNMRKRMEEIGGSFSISNASEGGTLVRLVAPLKE